MTIAAKLRSLRLARRLTIKAMAARVGVPSSTYRDWEYGRKINAEILSKLAEAFDVSLSELLGQDETKRGDLNQAMNKLEEALQILRKI